MSRGVRILLSCLAAVAGVLGTASLLWDWMWSGYKATADDSLLTATVLCGIATLVVPMLIWPWRRPRDLDEGDLPAAS